MFTIKPTKEYYQLESTRLQFIPLTEKLIPLWAEFFENNPTERFLGFEGSTKSSFEKAQFWIERQMNRKTEGQFGQLAVIEKETNLFIGLAGIIPRELKKTPEYEVTYSLLMDYWGKGYGTEAAVFFKNFLLDTTSCTSAISIIHIENEASINVAEKNGMFISDEITFMEMPVYVFRKNVPTN